VSVTAALLKHDVVLLDTLAYTVADPLTKAAGVAIAVVSPALLNQVTVTPAAPPVTVLLTLVKLNEAVPPPVVVSHKVMLAVLAAGLGLTWSVTAALLEHPVVSFVTFAYTTVPLEATYGLLIGDVSAASEK
jgi:hypothetical protein